jgi:GAF domain-containing protein
MTDRPDPLPHLSAVAQAVRREGQPRATFAALQAAMGEAIGHILFTVLLHHADSGASERVWTSHPTQYPVGGRKPLNPTPWTQQVLRDQRAFIGRTAEDIRAVFADHALIAALGCDSVLNVPVVWNGRTLGTLNLLHRAHWYREADMPLAEAFAALAVPAYLMLLTR